MTFFLPLTFRQNVHLPERQPQEQTQVLGADFFLLDFFAGAFLSAMFL